MLECSSGLDRATATELRRDDEPGGLVQLVLDGLGLMPSVLSFASAFSKLSRRLLSGTMSSAISSCSEKMGRTPG
jgi:hypothetical protein